MAIVHRACVFECVLLLPVLSREGGKDLQFIPFPYSLPPASSFLVFHALLCKVAALPETSVDRSVSTLVRDFSWT
jgi:hypothetical protein